MLTLDVKSSSKKTIIKLKKGKKSPSTGLEPLTPGVKVYRFDHSAIRAHTMSYVFYT